MRPYKGIPLCIGLLMIMLVVFGACSNEQQDRKQPDEYLPDSIQSEGVAASGCFSQLNRICDSGLAFAQLGQEVALMEGEGLSVTHIEDSTELEGGYIWLQRTLHFPDGFILLEGEFLQEKDYRPEKISQSLLNRIQIQTPSFSTEKDIRIGSTIAELSQKFEGSEPTLFSFGAFEEFRNNPEYEVLQIKFEEEPHINYLTPDPDFQLFEKYGTENLVLPVLPPDAIISKIVISN